MLNFESVLYDDDADGSISSQAYTIFLKLMQSLSRHLYDRISPSNKLSGLWFILTQHSMGKISMVNPASF